MNRRIQAYGVGTQKSGTVSLAAMFQKNYRTCHEAESEQIVYVTLARQEGLVTEEQYRQWVRERDARLDLEMDSSNFLVYLIDALVSEFAESKFILTIREPSSWLRSLLDHLMRNRNPPPYMVRFREERFNEGGLTHSPEENPLKERGLAPIAAYLRYWKWHNEMILKSVPRERLLVIRTDDLSHSLHEIADFLEIDATTMAAERSHSNRTPESFNVLKDVDPEYIAGQMREHCRDLLDRIFPDQARKP